MNNFEPRPCRHCGGFCGDSGPTCDERYDAVWGGAKTVEAVPNTDSGLGAVIRHRLFVYEVDFGDEGKGRYIRLSDFNKVVADYDAACEPFVRNNSSEEFINIRIPTSAVTKLRAMLAAAPAASGVDTSTNEAWAARAQEKIEAMDAASVSERARHGVVRATVRATDEDDVLHIECRFDDGQKYAAIETSGHKCEELARFIADALGQALTQQRGEPVFDRAWVVRDAELRAAAYNLLNLVEGVGCERWQNANGFRLKDTQQWVEFYIATKNVQSFGEPTTPQPSADAVRELVKRWRACAKSAANGPMFDGASEYAVAGTYIACADELESLLSAASGEKGVG